jgi:hypothetical protein
MGEAIEIIASHYVRLKDRVALERMRDHRNNLLQYAPRKASGWKPWKRRCKKTSTF